MPERQTVGAVLNKLIERTNSNIRRLRVLEQEAQIVKTRLTAAEGEVLAARRQDEKGLKDIEGDIGTLEERLANLEGTAKEIIAQLKKATTATRIKELEQLIDIYNPLKSQFVTREEVETLLEQKLRRRPVE